MHPHPLALDTVQAWEDDVQVVEEGIRDEAVEEDGARPAAFVHAHRVAPEARAIVVSEERLMNM